MCLRAKREGCGLETAVSDAHMLALCHLVWMLYYRGLGLIEISSSAERFPSEPAFSVSVFKTEGKYKPTRHSVFRLIKFNRIR